MSLKIANPSITRVENSFKQLAAAAQALNNASEDLDKVIRHLDASLKKLALGITAWVQVSGTSDETQYWTSEIGYAKTDGKWGVSLRSIQGYLLDNTDESEEVWNFSDAPRALRAEAVGKIPDLLEKMLQLTEETTKDLKEKTEQAAEITFLVSGLTPTPVVPAPQHWNRPVKGAVAAESSSRNTDQGGQGGDASVPAPFRETAAATPAAPAGSTAPNGRFREVETAPAERAAGAGRVLPTERVV